MNLASLRIITADIKRLVEFFEKITGLSAQWSTEDFAHPENNKSVIIEFLVENVDEQYNNIKDLLSEIVQKPTTMPWGIAHYYFTTRTVI